MWCVVGLGNPGPRYRGTRHNVGFAVLDRLADRIGVRLKERGKGREAEGVLDGVRVVLLEPLTFMNLSGLALRDVLKRFPITPDRVLVVHDDVDMPVGRVKIRSGGSAGGHRGVASLIAETGSREFVRLKIGVGRSAERSVSDHVLGRFAPDEAALVAEAVAMADEAACEVVVRGASSAMNRYNQKAQPASGSEGDPPPARV